MTRHHVPPDGGTPFKYSCQEHELESDQVTKSNHQFVGNDGNRMC